MFKVRSRKIAILVMVVFILSMMQVVPGLSVAEEGTESSESLTETIVYLHNSHEGTNSETTDEFSCEHGENGGLTGPGVVWHFVLNQLDKETPAGILTAVFQSAGDKTVEATGDGQNQQFWVLTPTDDILLSASAAVNTQVDPSKPNLVLSHICRQLGDPGNDDPGNDDPGNDDPGNDDPGNDDPGNDDPGNDDPGNDDPGNDDPGNDDPGNDDPGNDDPGNDDPGNDDPGNDDPGNDDPGNDDPGNDDPGNDDPGNDDPGNDDPGNDDPGNDDPGNDDPGNDDPGNDDPGNDDPGNDDPGNDDPGNDDPGNDDPGNDDPGNGDDDQTDEDETLEVIEETPAVPMDQPLTVPDSPAPTMPNTGGHVLAYVLGGLGLCTAGLVARRLIK